MTGWCTQVRRYYYEAWLTCELQKIIKRDTILKIVQLAVEASVFANTPKWELFMEMREELKCT